MQYVVCSLCKEKQSTYKDLRILEVSLYEVNLSMHSVHMQLFFLTMTLLQCCF